MPVPPQPNVPASAMSSHPTRAWVDKIPTRVERFPIAVLPLSRGRYVDVAARIWRRISECGFHRPSNL